MIEFFINGKKYYSSRTISIKDLINYFSYNSELLILEYNEIICNKKNWPYYIITTNDKIEIISIVGGG